MLHEQEHQQPARRQRLRQCTRPGLVAGHESEQRGGLGWDDSGEQVAEFVVFQQRPADRPVVVLPQNQQIEQPQHAPSLQSIDLRDDAGLDVCPVLEGDGQQLHRAKYPVTILHAHVSPPPIRDRSSAASLTTSSLSRASYISCNRSAPLAPGSSGGQPVSRGSLQGGEQCRGKRRSGGPLPGRLSRAEHGYDSCSRPLSRGSDLREQGVLGFFHGDPTHPVAYTKPAQVEQRQYPTNDEYRMARQAQPLNPRHGLERQPLERPRLPVAATDGLVELHDTEREQSSEHHPGEPEVQRPEADLRRPLGPALPGIRYRRQNSARPPPASRRRPSSRHGRGLRSAPCRSRSS